MHARLNVCIFLEIYESETGHASRWITGSLLAIVKSKSLNWDKKKIVVIGGHFSPVLVWRLALSRVSTVPPGRE